MSSMMCIAHRGGPLACKAPLPENSLAAIGRALSLGAPAIEIDIYAVEGQLIVTHDRRLGRVVSGQGLIPHLSLAYLRQQTLENGEPLPLLTDVLSLVGDKAQLNIEIKGANCVPLLHKTLDDFCREQGYGNEHYVISSFDHQQLYQSLQLMPNIRRGVLIEGVPLDYAQCCEALKAYSLNNHLSFLTAELLADARQRGFYNWVYTANHLDDWQWLHDMGVNAVFTDKPDELMAFVATNTRL